MELPVRNQEEETYFFYPKFNDSIDKSFKVSVTSGQVGEMQRLDIHKEFYKDLEREQDRKTHTEKYHIISQYLKY